jgi:hypothetical protein
MRATNSKKKISIDGDFYEQRKSVLPNLLGEAKNLITTLRKIWESWNLEILHYIDINLKLRHWKMLVGRYKTYTKQNKTIWRYNIFFFRFTPYIHNATVKNVCFAVFKLITLWEKYEKVEIWKYYIILISI